MPKVLGHRFLNSLKCSYFRAASTCADDPSGYMGVHGSRCVRERAGLYISIADATRIQPVSASLGCVRFEKSLSVFFAAD